MTRASLLHIFNHVGSISEAEVRELEQLAAAFPYCQTAHLLLAKAAHDQGSMLASQRLRRAATYAVDRQLLRQLLEQPSPVTSAIEAPAPKELKAAETDGSALTSVTSNSTAFFQALVPEDVQPIETQEEDAATNAEEVTAETTATAIPLSDDSIAATAAEQPTEIEQVAISSSEPDASLELPQELVEDPTTLAAEPILIEVADICRPVEIPTEPTPTEHSETAEPTSAIAESEELLPPIAPPIRPPADAGISRFEFGLSEPEDQLIPVLYQLPGLQDEGSDVEAEQEALSPVPTTATALAPPFRSDTTLAYSLLPEGSRLGYALQLQDEELTQPLPIAEFFPPDALLHAHATHQHQPTALTPSSLDLINRFLKVQPRLKSPVIVPQVQEQPDLAARSTSAPPALASESLAKILIKQGKKDRAIEIYEQLMVRQPEKSAYFVDQIQQLKTPE